MHTRLDDRTWVPTAADFPSVFTLREFEAASHHPLGAAETRAAYWWIYKGGLLEARQALGPIRITSYARTPDSSPGCHEDGRGNAIDLVPVNTSIGRLHRWFAEFSDRSPRTLGEVLDESRASSGAHLHLTRWPCGVGEYSQVLRLTGYSGGLPVWEDAYARPELLYALVVISALVVIFFS